MARPSSNQPQMPALPDTHKDGPVCDICGDIGVVDAIVTCLKCKISTEHVYCMCEYREDISLDWRCEECESDDVMLSLQSNMEEHLPANTTPSSSATLYVGLPSPQTNVMVPPQSIPKKDLPTSSTRDSKSLGPGWNRPFIASRYNWREKEAKTGRTKYLWSKEVIKMSSGDNKKDEVNSRVALLPLAGAHKKPKYITPANLSVKVNTNPSFGAFRSLDRSKPAEISPVVQARKGNNAGNSPAKGHAQMDQTTNRLKVAEDIGTSSPKMQKAIGKAECASLLSTYCHSPIPPIISGGSPTKKREAKSFDAENGSIMNFVVINEKSLPTDPASFASWKGSFKLKDDDSCVGFWAHPPSRVLSKVFEFSTKMPQLLEFELLPLRDFWVTIFQENCPNKDDIGLYFIPRNERSKKYISLLERLSEEELVMRCLIDGVELIVFGSNMLNVDSRKWSKNEFLWGLYRSMKRENGSGPHDLNGVSKDNNNMVVDMDTADDLTEAGEDVDMDVDMLGGESVGKPDIVIRREASAVVKVEMSDDVFDLLPGFGVHSKEMHIDTPPCFGVPLKGMQNNIPPGFGISSSDDLLPGFRITSRETQANVPPDFGITSREMQAGFPPGFGIPSRVIFEVPPGFTQPLGLPVKIKIEKDE